MSITDDGQGFDAIDYYRHGRDANKGHHGLSVMSERAQSLEGKLQVLSMPQKGTEIKLEIPVNSNGKVEK
jgi:signal transduction histidine kinase